MMLNTVSAMRDAVFFEGEARSRRLSRFWILLTLSSVIAAAGVAADSTATVIGAMIVAPMMLPIQGAMLATVLGDRANLVRSTLLILAGTAVSVAIGYAVGMLVPGDIVAASNSQVAGRVSPRLIDLLAALATGVVGSIALVRKDIADTLPGVAIAISLVPPLTVAGLTLESHAFGQALGALWLFATNVASILITGIIVMTVFRVRASAAPSSEPRPRRLRTSTIVITTMLVLIGVPLSFSSVNASTQARTTATIQSVASQWADGAGWNLVIVDDKQEGIVIRVTGSPPEPSVEPLKRQLEESGVSLDDVRVELIPSSSIDLADP